MLYVPAAVGVQVTLLPLLTQPEPDAGLVDNVKSSVFCLVTLSVPTCPVLMFSVRVIEIFTVGGLLGGLLLEEESSPPQAANNIKNIVTVMNPAFFRWNMFFHWLLIVC